MKLQELFTMVRVPIKAIKPHPAMKVIKPKKPRGAIKPHIAPRKPRHNRQKVHF